MNIYEYIKYRITLLLKDVVTFNLKSLKQDEILSYLSLSFARATDKKWIHEHIESDLILLTTSQC